MIRPHVREKRHSRNSESAFTHTAIKRSNYRIILVSHEEYQRFQLKSDHVRSLQGLACSKPQINKFRASSKNTWAKI